MNKSLLIYVIPFCRNNSAYELCLFKIILAPFLCVKFGYLLSV